MTALPDWTKIPHLPWRFKSYRSLQTTYDICSYKSFKILDGRLERRPVY